MLHMLFLDPLPCCKSLFSLCALLSQKDVAKAVGFGKLSWTRLRRYREHALLVLCCFDFGALALWCLIVFALLHGCFGAFVLYCFKALGLYGVCGFMAFVALWALGLYGV